MSASINVTVGDVVRFDYLQPLNGLPSRFGKVVKIRDTHVDRILQTPEGLIRHYYWHRGFQRSRYLITIIDTHGIFRQFYLERCQSVVKPFFGRLRFAMQSLYNKFAPRKMRIVHRTHEA